MIELAKHIEILLLDNDCVIVPELGGFIAHHQQAYYNENEGVYFPPIRTIGFNPQLTMNDGLLTQAYMQTYHTDYPDALRRIAEKVSILKETLYNDGMVELSSLGNLYYTIHNTYEFHPNEHGILAPALYALDSFLISPLSAEIIEETPDKKVKPIQSPIVEKKKNIHWNYQWIGNAVAVAVAVVLFFALSVPVENTHIDKGVYASLGTDCLFDAIRSQSIAISSEHSVVNDIQKQKKDKIAPIVVKVEKVDPAPKQQPLPLEKKATEAKKQEPQPKVVQQKKNYHIIVASLTTSSDAKRMLQEYKQQGYVNASIKESKGRYRISICSYADKSIAYDKLNEFKQSDSFKGAWMLVHK